MKKAISDKQDNPTIRDITTLNDWVTYFDINNSNSKLHNIIKTKTAIDNIGQSLFLFFVHKIRIESSAANNNTNGNATFKNQSLEVVSNDMTYRQTQDTIVSISMVIKTSERLHKNGKTKKHPY